MLDHSLGAPTVYRGQGGCKVADNARSISDTGFKKNLNKRVIVNPLNEVVEVGGYGFPSPGRTKPVGHAAKSL
jgi:hypothetical protein